jgi:hypothetical protein
MLGEPQTVTTTLYAETDARYGPRFRFSLVSRCDVRASGERRRARGPLRPRGPGDRLSVPLDERCTASTLRPRLAAAWPAPGARFTHQVLSPTSLRREPVRVLVEGHETIDGVETLRIVEESQGLESRAWIDRRGRALREQGALGFVLRREAADVARSGVGDGVRVDLATTTRVPFEGTIADPRSIEYVMRVTGGPRLRARRPAAPARHGRRRPHHEADAGRGGRRDDLDCHRGPSPFASPTPAIVSRARAIVGRRRCRATRSAPAPRGGRERRRGRPHHRHATCCAAARRLQRHAVLVAAPCGWWRAGARRRRDSVRGDGFYYHA